MNLENFKSRQIAMDYATMFEITASFVEKFATAEEAAAALENLALTLRRKWSGYPVAAPGEREYRSWLP